MVNANTPNNRGLDRDSVWDLRQQACRWDSKTTPLSLWLVPEDPATDPMIERIQELEGALVLRRLTPERDWKIMDDDLRTAIVFAVDKLPVSSLVICGHSACGGIWSNPCEPRRPPERSGYQRLLRGIQCRQERLNLQRQQVVDLVNELTDSSLIWKAFRLGRVSVHGVFYLAEAGLFTLYDPWSGHFVSLAKSWAAK